MNTEIKEETLKKETFRIKPFRNICVGDPLYLEEIARGSDDAIMKDLTVNTKTRCCTVGACTISLVRSKEKSLEWSSINVDIHLAETEEQLNVYLSDRWYGEKTVKERYNLACDTAKFDVTIDGRYDRFHTGADGYYGTAIKYKEHFGFYLGLSFDEDMHSFEEINTRIRYLLNAE